jgi:TetR/AcrR family transcriptional regulator
MLSKTFHRLPSARQQVVLDAAMREFTVHGYESASTNRIVASLGIAKGTLFKYARTKAALYLYLYEQVLTEIAVIQDDPATYTTPDLFLRVEDLFEALLAYAAREPLRYRFSMRASLDTAASLHAEVELLRQRVAREHYTALFDGVDWELYALPRDQVIELFAWVFNGSRAAAVQALDPDYDHETYVALVRRQLVQMRLLLWGGVYRIPRENP